MTSVDTIATIEGSVEDGGWRASGEVFGDADRVSWHQEIMAWVDAYIGGWERLPRLAFRGHALPDPFRKTFQTSELKWSAFTVQEFMKRGEVQGIFFKDESSPANAHQINGMTYAAIVEHIVGKSGEYGHCNLVDGVWPEGIMTLNIDSTNSSAIDEYEVKQGNFWTRLREIADIEFYVIYVSKDNQFNYVPHPMFDTTLADVTIDLDSGLLIEPLTIAYRNDETIGQVRLQGTTPRGLQISGKYPTDPEPGPIIQKVGYLATDNSKMTAVATRMYKFKNRDYTVTAKIGNGLGLMLDLLDRVSITYTSSADGITWTAKKFWIHGVTVDIKENFSAETTLVLEAENA